MVTGCSSVCLTEDMLAKISLTANQSVPQFSGKSYIGSRKVLTIKEEGGSND